MTAQRKWQARGASVKAVTFLVAAIGMNTPARAQDIATEWIDGEHHRARLTAGHVTGAAAGTVTAFFEVSMDKGWKTYWRNPGTAGGIPPEFDWSKSINVSKVEVLFPVPQIMSDTAGDVIGYREYAIFPLRIVPADVHAPVELKLTANYGICAKLCVPAEVDLSLAIPPAPLPPAGPDAEHAFAMLPKVGVDRRPDDPSDLKVMRPADKPGLIQLSAAFPGDPAAARIFLSVPDGRYLPLPVRREGGSGPAGLDAKGERVTFEVDLTSPDDLAALKGARVNVVLAGEKGQSEESFVID